MTGRTDTTGRDTSKGRRPHWDQSTNQRSSASAGLRTHTHTQTDTYTHTQIEMNKNPSAENNVVERELITGSSADELPDWRSCVWVAQIWDLTGCVCRRQQCRKLKICFYSKFLCADGRQSFHMEANDLRRPVWLVCSTWTRATNQRLALLELALHGNKVGKNKPHS